MRLVEGTCHSVWFRLWCAGQTTASVRPGICAGIGIGIGTAAWFRGEFGELLSRFCRFDAIQTRGTATEGGR